MSERSDILESIAKTIQDYREGEIVRPTPEHVEKWITQFGKDVQLPLLHEVDHIFKSTYLNREYVSGFLGVVVKTTKLAGTDPCAYWAKIHFLDIQKNGHSQKEMLPLFNRVLNEECGLSIDKCGQTAGDYIYLDDVIFSGSRVGNDLAAWIEKAAPEVATVHVIVAAIHSGGEYLLGKRLKETINASKKRIDIKYWRAKNIENRKYYKDDSEVLWPTEIPDNAQVQAYAAKPHKFPFEPRRPGGQLGPFSSEEGRQLLEREMLIAGVKIRAKSKNPKDILRPLGFSPFGLGFGSMVITFRNCANNCPLALWWGDPEATSGPFHWYPLLPRKTYDE